ncbi:integrin-linked protein kinase 1-like protein isoform X1 [Tanacetum coccineum]
MRAIFERLLVYTSWNQPARCSGGLLKVAGFALIRLSKISPNKARLVRPATVDRENLYIAPEIYKDKLFDGDQMMEGVQPFYPKAPEEAVKLMCVDVQRPTFKTKSKYYPPDLKELIEECWYPVSIPTLLDQSTK